MNYHSIIMSEKFITFNLPSMYPQVIRFSINWIIIAILTLLCLQRVHEKCLRYISKLANKVFYSVSQKFFNHWGLSLLSCKRYIWEWIYVDIGCPMINLITIFLDWQYLIQIWLIIACPDFERLILREKNLSTLVWLKICVTS